MRSKSACLVLAAAALPAACGRGPDETTTIKAVAMEDVAPPRAPTQTSLALKVQSQAFDEGGMIPARYTADAENVSPPLAWSPGPLGTSTYALIMDDPDSQAGVWTHWVLWNEPNVRLDEDVRPTLQLPDGALQGRNSWQKTGYGGPQPPTGIHRYSFRVYALDARLDVAPDSDRAAVEAAMQGHVLAQGELMGRYEAKK